MGKGKSLGVLFMMVRESNLTLSIHAYKSNGLEIVYIFVKLTLQNNQS